MVLLDRVLSPAAAPGRGAIAALLIVLVTALPAAADDPDPVGEWPLVPQPEVVAGFDPPDLPWGAGHRGVDLRGHLGQAVHTALAGRVSFAGAIAGRGVVLVDHGETRTTYEPVAASVSVGVSLPQGAVVGTLELVGSHCPPAACLHWGWLRGEEYLDPLGLLGAGPVRLLPLWRDEPVDPLAPPGQAVAAFALPRLTPYATVLRQLADLARSPPTYARGCACW